MQIRTDHLLHALCAYAIATTIAAVLAAFGVATASVWGVGLALLAGAIKEAYDAITHKGTAEFSDFVADLVGCIVAIIVSMLLRI